MKKYYFLTLLLTLFISGFSFGQTAVITGYVDAPCSGATPRAVEIYVDGTIDFTDWDLSRQSNGGSFNYNIDLTTLGVISNAFVYVTNSISNLDAEFGITENVISNSGISSNGDDAFQLTDNSSAVIDRFGEVGVDGTGTAWEHVDTYAYRNDIASPNAGLFDSNNWTFGAQNLLDGTCGTTLNDLVPLGTYQAIAPNATINITTSGGSYATEKWVNITTAIDGSGTQVWGQGNGSYWDGRGLINQNIELSPGTYYVNCYDYYGDGWDGTAISVTSYGSVLASGSPSISGAYLAASYQIIVPNPPSCLPPSSLAASVSSSSEATVSWTAGSSETAWEYVVQAAGTGEPTASGIATTTNPLSLSGLTASTAYEIYVRANCGGDVSSWVSTSFTTLCESNASFPYLESFETITSGQPDCWSLEGTTTPSTYHFSSFESGQSGRGMIFDSYNNSIGNTSELITPMMDASALTSLELNFQFANPTGGNFEILISNDGGATYTSLESGLTAQGSWIPKNYDLTSYISSSILVKFKGTSNYGPSGAYVYLDEVGIREIPSCQEPTAITVDDNTTSTTADISWTAGGTEEAWEYVLQALDTGEPTASGTPTTTNSLTLTGLTPSTGYEIYIRSVCDGNFSGWVKKTFLSSADCSPNTNAFVHDFQTAVLGSALDASCWSVSNGGDTNTWGLVSDTSTGNVFWNLSYSTTAHDDYLYSPIISVVDGVTDGFNFKGWNPLANYPEVIDVLVVDVSGATLGTLATNLLLPGVPSVFTYSLDAYEGQDVRIALHSTSRDQYFARIDDFTVLSPINLTINGVSVDNKTYDGATTGSASGTPSLSGVVSGDEVFVSGSPTFTFASVNVGTDITVNTTGYTLSGADAGKYILTQPTLSADITPKALTITGIAGVNKVYDGSTFADATGAAALLGLETGDIVTLGGTPSFTFASVNAGTGITVNTVGYIISGADSGNYTLTQPTLSADITAKVLTITGISGNDKVYDGTTAGSITGTAALSGLVSGDNLYLVGSPSFAFVSANVGSNITINTSGYLISGTNVGNYSLIQPDLLADITSKGLTITGISGVDKVYDGTTAASTTGSATLLSGISGDDVSLGGSPIFTFATANVGTAITVNTSGYTISGTASANYTLTQPTLSADITQKELTITGISADNKVYDGITSATTSGTAVLSGVETGDDVTLGGSSIFSFASANVGTVISVATSGYIIGGVDSANYMLTLPTLSADITQAGLTISATAGLTKVYGASDPTLTYSISGFVNGNTEADLDTPVTIARTAGEDVGIYAISGSATDANYNINFVTNTFSITAASLEVSTDYGEKTYGDADPSLNYSISGFVNGDTEVDLDTPVTIIRIPGEDVGSYQIIAYNALDSNYNIIFKNNESFSINRRAITLTASNQDKIYGDLLDLGETAFTVLDLDGDGILPNGELIDTVTLVSATGVDASTTADVGTYVDEILITPTSSGDATLTGSNGFDQENYLVAYQTGDLTINRRAITLTADAGQGKVYGSADPTLTYMISGFVNGDTEADLDTSVMISRAAGEDVGDYAITVSGATDANYTISFVGSTFSITQAGLTVTADAGQGKVYGSADPTLTYMISGFVNGDTEADLDTSVMISRAAGEDVGDYAITTSGATDANYTISFVGSTFSITQAGLTVTADAGQGKVYGAIDPVLSYTITGFQGTDNEASLDTGVMIFRVAGENVGDYTITPSGATDSNYSISFVTSTFTITPAGLTVTADAGLSKVYGTVDPTLTYMISGFQGADTEADLDTPVMIARVAGEDVGAYTITPSGASDSNYSISFVTSTFEITPASLTVTADAGFSKVYGTTDPIFTYMITGFIGVDNEASLDTPVSISRAGGEDVGQYTITPSGAADINYSISFVTSTFEITQAALLVTADSGLSKVYGNNDPTLTYMITGFVNGDTEANLDTPVTNTRAVGEDVGTYTITPSGAADINYSISFVESTFEITPADLIIIGLVGKNKVYDETTVATTTGTAILSGIVSNDDVTLGGSPVFTFESPEPGILIMITTTGYTITGSDSGNYTLTQPTLYADITNPDEDCDGDGIVDSQDSDFSTCASAIRNTTRYGFSPNGDGINDVWTIEKILAYPNNVVKVFNRSGKLVFEQRGYQNDWNGESNQLSGNSNGYKLPVGAYIFMLDLGDGNAFVRGWLYINY